MHHAKMSMLAHLLPITVVLVLMVTAQAQRCGPGKFLQNNYCILCPPGFWKSNLFFTECKPCQKGTYNPYSGAQGIDVCIPCPQNTFNNRARASSRAQCLPCPPGTFSPPGSPHCLRCEPGQRAYFDLPIIGVCNFFHEEFRSTAFLCSEGDSNELRKLTCIIDYDIPFKYTCRPCYSDSFTDEPNASEICKCCPAGTTSNSERTMCLPAPPCPPRSVRSGRSDCRECSDFRVSDRSSDNCRACPQGFLGNKENGATGCIPCSAGTARSPSRAKCSACKPGENSFVTGAQFCLPGKTPCAPNFFRNSNGVCTKCTTGQRFEPNSKSCIQCPDNAVSSGALSTTYSPCPPPMKASEIRVAASARLDTSFRSQLGCKPALAEILSLRNLSRHRFGK